jgi:uncharacterized protein YndB with AHSA1/START domain
MSTRRNTPTKDAADRELVITRVFDAPRELLWKAWTEPERLKFWWAPKGSTWVSGTLDLRPGGLFHYCVRPRDSADIWGKLRYHEIAPPERLEFIVSFSDAQGGTTRHPMSQTWPLEVRNTVTLSEHKGRTTLTLSGLPHNASEAERHTFTKGHASMQQGFKGSFDQLEAYLVGARH